MQSRAELFFILRDDENKRIINVIPNRNGYVVIKKNENLIWNAENDLPVL